MTHKDAIGIAAVLLVYGALVLGALVGFVLYLIRENPGMATVYLLLLSLLIGLAVYLGNRANDQSKRVDTHDPPAPPAVAGLRTHEVRVRHESRGSGNIGRRWP